MNSKDLSSTIKKVLTGDSDVREAVSPHQREFPYGRDSEAQVTRREFCNFLVLTSSALFVSTGAFTAKAIYDSRFAEVLPKLNIEDAGSLGAGESLNFRYPMASDSAILIRSRDGEYFAYGQKCTHLACPVYFEKNKQRLECPCHEAGFDMRTGAVLYGPPPRPLDKIVLDIRENGEVWAVGKISGDYEHE